MGSYMNFKNFEDTSQPDSTGNENPAFNYPFPQSSGNYPLSRLYSLTFDEIQTTLGGGKDLGSLNMEELLKSIWNAEEPLMASSVGGGEGGSLMRQGSLTLPRTLSHKTVDQVWRDVLKDTSSKDGNSDGTLNLGQQEPSLSELTLEEFLSKAGVVRENVPNYAGVSYNGLPPISANNSVGFQESSPTGLVRENVPNYVGVSYNGLPPTSGNNSIGFQESSRNQNHSVFVNQVVNPSNLAVNLAQNPQPSVQTGFDTNTQNSIKMQRPLQTLFPKQTTLTFSNPSQNGGNNTQFPNVGVNNITVQSGGMVMGGLQKREGSHMHLDAIVKSDIDMETIPPIPYNLGEIRRGRRSSTSLEKVVERRRKRMLKNRESAARSRARKQAYTLELEAEITHLKEMNNDLRKRQEELLQIEKNQMLEKMNGPWGGRRRCLTRTITGPW